MNILENIMSMFTNTSKNDNNTAQGQQNQTVSYYPESFYTRSYSMEHKQDLQAVPTSPSGGLLSSLLSSDMLKRLIPLFTQKDKKLNFNDILGNLNPNISSILSTFTSLNNNNKKTKEENTNTKDVIDISNYTEVS